MSRLVPIAVLLVVLAAGCLGTTGPPESASTTTPTDATTGTTTDAATTTAPTTDPTGQVAPGVTGEGVENATALLAAHATILRERGFEVAYEWRSETAGESRVLDRRLVATPGLRRFRSEATVTIAGEESVQRSWLDESTTRMLNRIETGDGTEYRTPPVGPVGSEQRASYVSWAAEAHRLADLLQNAEFTVARTNESGDRRYVLVADDLPPTDSFGEREVELVVDAGGVVRRLEASGSLPDGGSFSYTYRVVRLGVETVERPAWVANAPEPVDARPTAGFENCTNPYVVLENRGPDALPAGTVATLTLDGTEHRATLDAGLAAGERRAIYLDSSGRIRVAALDAVPVSRTAMPNEAEMTVVTGDGLVLSNSGFGFGCATASEGSGGSEGGSGSSSGSEGSGSSSGGSGSGG